MTRGGPSNSTTILMYEVYRQAFDYTSFGKAAAISSVLLAIIGVVVFFELRLLRSNFEYGPRVGWDAYCTSADSAALSVDDPDCPRHACTGHVGVASSRRPVDRIFATTVHFT